MRLTTVVALVAALAALQLAAGPAPARAQALLPEEPEGEEEQIRQREEWFAASRGLRRVSRPDLLRAAAVQDLARRRAARADELRLSGQVWQSVGPIASTVFFNLLMSPVSGRVASLAVHPADEQTLYLGGASGGLWKTTNGGASWTPIFDDVGTLTISALVLREASPAGTPEVLWVGTGERGNCLGYFGLGLFRSTDGGASFTARNGAGTTALELSFIESIAVHPADGDTLLVSGSGFCGPGGTPLPGGVFKSTNAGETWRRVKTGPVTDVIYNFLDPNVVYLQQGHAGVYKSVDGGETWAPSNGGTIVPSSRMRLAMAPGDPAVLYSLGGNSHLYRTADGGATWTLATTTACDSYGGYALAIDVHPADPDRILVGGIQFRESRDGGTTWAPMDVWDYVHVDNHVLRYSRLSPTRLWAGTDGGLWRTDNEGSTYVNLNTNLSLTQLYDVAVSHADPDNLFGGTQDNSSLRRINTPQWETTVYSGDGAKNAVDPADAARIFQGSTTSPGGTALFFRSVTGGDPNSFSQLPSTGIQSNEPWTWVTPLEVLPGMLLTASHSVYRADAAAPAPSFSWTKISPPLDTSPVFVVTVHAPGPSSPPDGWGAYVGTSLGTIWRGTAITGPGPAWADVTGNYPVGLVTDIAVDPANPEWVYVTRGLFDESRLYGSKTGGKPWSALGAGLPDLPANAVAVDPIDPNRVFVGTDVGVYESTDYGATFAPFSQGLPLGVVITDLEVDDDPHSLVAATYGRGAYRVDLLPVAALPAPAEAGTTTGHVR